MELVASCFSNICFLVTSLFSVTVLQNLFIIVHNESLKQSPLVLVTHLNKHLSRLLTVATVSAFSYLNYIQ